MRFSPIRSQAVLEPEPDISSPDSEIPSEHKPPVFADGHHSAPAFCAVTLTFNKAKNGLQLHFPDKPDEDIRAELKAAGWRWSFRNHCWYHRDTDANRDFAEQFVARLNRRGAEAQSENFESQTSNIERSVIPIPLTNSNGVRAQAPAWRRRLFVRP